jgi:hypothetical protein
LFHASRSVGWLQADGTSGAFSFLECEVDNRRLETPVLRRTVTVFHVMDEDCGVRKAYMLLLGRKNPHSSLTIA